MKRTLIALWTLALMGCNAGLSPTPAPKPGIQGTIYFAAGTWPGTPQSPDSLSNLWIFASQIFPLDSSLVFNGLLTSNPPTIFLYPSLIGSLPLYVDTLQYDFELPMGLYKYVGVIQHIGIDYYSIQSYRVVGVAKDPADTSKPLMVQVTEGSANPTVNMYVDFHHPPVQPF
jgi:hypothetical protein